MVPAWDAPAAMPLLGVSQMVKTAACGQWFAILTFFALFTFHERNLVKFFQIFIEHPVMHSIVALAAIQF